MDSVANYASISTLFSTSVTGRDVLCKAPNISQIRLPVAPQDSSFTVFLCSVTWHHNSAKFRTAFLDQFRTSLRMASVANYASIWTLFWTSVTGRDVLCKAPNTSQICLQVAPQDSQNCGRNFAKRKQSDVEFAGNTTHGYY